MIHAYIAHISRDLILRDVNMFVEDGPVDVLVTHGRGQAAPVREEAARVGRQQGVKVEVVNPDLGTVVCGGGGVVKRPESYTRVCVSVTDRAALVTNVD